MHLIKWLVKCKSRRVYFFRSKKHPYHKKPDFRVFNKKKKTLWNWRGSFLGNSKNNDEKKKIIARNESLEKLCYKISYKGIIIFGKKNMWNSMINCQFSNKVYIFFCNNKIYVISKSWFLMANSRSCREIRLIFFSFLLWHKQSWDFLTPS